MTDISVFSIDFVSKISQHTVSTQNKQVKWNFKKRFVPGRLHDEDKFISYKTKLEWFLWANITPIIPSGEGGNKKV